LRSTYSNSNGQFYFGQLVSGNYQISLPDYSDTISFKIKNDSCTWLSIDNKLKKVISSYQLCHCGSFEIENSKPENFSLKVQFIDQHNGTPINNSTAFFSISENELKTNEQGKLNFDFKLASNNNRLTRGHRTYSIEVKPSEKILAYLEVKGYVPYWFYIVPSFLSDDTYIPEYFREFDFGIIELKKNDKPVE
jgi:hypothetical protein